MKLFEAGSRWHAPAVAPLISHSVPFLVTFSRRGDAETAELA